MIVYPPDTQLSVLIHERDLIWMVRPRSLSLFRHSNIEVAYFPTTPAMRFWDESEPDKRDLLFRVFLRAFLLGEKGSPLPVPFDEVRSLVEQHRKHWEQVKEVRLDYEW